MQCNWNSLFPQGLGLLWAVLSNTWASDLSYREANGSRVRTEGINIESQGLLQASMYNTDCWGKSQLHRACGVDNFGIHEIFFVQLKRKVMV